MPNTVSAIDIDSRYIPISISPTDIAITSDVFSKEGAFTPVEIILLKFCIMTMILMTVAKRPISQAEILKIKLFIKF